MQPYESNEDLDYVAASKSSDADGLPIEDDNEDQPMVGDAFERRRLKKLSKKSKKEDKKDKKKKDKKHKKDKKNKKDKHQTKDELMTEPAKNEEADHKQSLAP